MKRYNTEDTVHCLDEYDYQIALRRRFYSSDWSNQKEYSLESVSFTDDGEVNYSLRVENLFNSDSYLVQRLVA